MKTIRITDSNREKCLALREAGILVNELKNDRSKRYVISLIDFPDADKYIETSFNSITDILKAFSDRLKRYCINFKFE